MPRYNTSYTLQTTEELKSQLKDIADMHNVSINIVLNVLIKMAIELIPPETLHGLLQEEFSELPDKIKSRYGPKSNS